MDFLNVLESQRQLYISEDQLVQSEGGIVVHLDALYKALGWGWLNAMTSRRGTCRGGESAPHGQASTRTLNPP